MKKILTIVVLVLGSAIPLFAAHIKGGEIYYDYIGAGTAPNTAKYRITLKLYIDCSANSAGQLDPSVPLTVFNKDDNSEVTTVIAPLDDEMFLRFDPQTNPCIGNPPLDVCYRVRTYTTTIEVSNTSVKGYVITYQRCCRIIDIRNLQAPSNSYGATYYSEIPGTDIFADGYKNSSPRFITNDAAAICKGSSFVFDFGATDPDKGDSLSYTLCNGFIGASQGNPSPSHSSKPPYTQLPYNSPYSGDSPLGANASINAKTGIVSGIAPSILGQYVITACVSEYRKGKLINIHHKDIHVAVSDCIPLKALLKPDYAFCDDFLVTFRNEQFNPSGSVYTWDFGDGSPAENSTEPDGKMQHQYADAGTYNVKMKVVLAGQCIDSTTTVAKVYPGFFPGFVSSGSCLYTPFQFTDTTKTRYGKVSSWTWSFGDETSEEDASAVKNPHWLYSSLGLKKITLIVESDKGCKGTVTGDVEVRDVPLLSVPFRDTLICSVDSLDLHAIGHGVFSWTPATRILNQNTANPKVFPTATTTYRVNLNENGCVSSDTVRVRVVDFVTLSAGKDTVICATDTIQLNPSSDGLQFTWTPATNISDPLARQPFVYPVSPETYSVQARVGSCVSNDQIHIKTVPYPTVSAGNDTVVCFRDTASLNGGIIGSRFNWSPSQYVSSPSVLNPKAYPTATTTFRLTAFDTLGCPKPGFDDVVVTVRDEIHAFAGNDTAIVIGQPLMMTGTGAELFEWSPPIGLNQPGIQSPVAQLENDMTYVLKAFSEEGCFDFDTINVKVFKTKPDIFVPNAFAPGGYNRILQPVAPGIATLEYFRIYNRWGQMVFQTSQIGKGWDGIYAGKLQDGGTYVWMVRGKDYTGKTISRQGTSILIR